MCEARRQRLPDSAAGLQSRLQVGMRTPRPARTRSGATASSSGRTPLAQATAPLWAVCHLARPRIGAVISLCSLPPPTLGCHRLCLRRLETSSHPARAHPASPGPVGVPRLLPIIPLQCRLLLRQPPSVRSSLRPSVCHPHPPAPAPPFPVPRAHVWITIAFLITPCKIQLIFCAVVRLRTRYHHHHPPIGFPSRSLAGGHRL